MSTKEIKTIGVLTSGGDAPGMNAAVRAVVRCALNRGLKVYGIYKGYNGLINDEVKELNAKSVAKIMHLGGTKLYTARCPEFLQVEYQKKAAETAKKYGIDGLVVIGGDGSFRGAQDLSRFGINVVGIPATIDKDIACSDYTIGFDTAANIVLDAMRRLRDTCASHERCSIIEVMGRRCGELAVTTGLCGGADLIMIPEKPETANYEGVINIIHQNRARGKDHNMIVVAEGMAKDGYITSVTDLAKKIEADTGIETRATILGHIQRGGQPTVFDIRHATMFGAKAVDTLIEGKNNRVIAFAYKSNSYVDLDIDEALAMKKEVAQDMLDVNALVSTY